MKEIVEKIKAGKRIMITTHVNPDGDGIGAGLGLMLAINKMNTDRDKVVRFAIDDKVPFFLDFLEHSVLIENTAIIESRFDFDTVISVDAATFERIGESKKFIKEDTVFINIDHHISNTKFGKINYIDDKASSTSEIIYELTKELGVEMDAEIGKNLYTGIVNDTGNFAYSNTSVSTFEAAAALKKAGVNTEEVTRNMFQRKRLGGLRALGAALNKFEFFAEKKLAYYFLSYKDMVEYGTDKADTEGIVESLRGYEECDVSLFVREEADGKLKGSFRSNEKDVNKIAESFGGGGHRKAAGFNTTMSKEEVLKIVLEQL
jgi:bifunctional oligoribonuclease and PAP phosphatase NrnA